MRTVRYSIIESDLAENGTVGSMRLAEELVKSPYGSPELWDALSGAIKFAKEKIDAMDKEAVESPNLYRIWKIGNMKAFYLAILDRLEKGMQAAIEATRGFTLDRRIDADPYVGVGSESRRRLLNELNPKDAEDLLKKLSDLTLLNPYEVGLYLMRQKHD